MFKKIKAFFKEFLEEQKQLKKTRETRIDEAEKYNKKHEPREWPEYIFHGGCHHCTQQQLNPIQFCMGCQYFEADWTLPNLNNRPLDKGELMRNQLKEMKRHYQKTHEAPQIGLDILEGKEKVKW